MIITTQYMLVLILAVFLTLLAWSIESSWVIKKTGGLGKLKTIRNLTATLLVVLIVWMVFMNFTATLTLFVFSTGVIVLVDKLFFRKKRQQANYPDTLIVENARSFFFVLLIVWVIRSFILQPYR